MKKYWYVMHNEQGAVLGDGHVDTVAEIKEALEQYYDPQNIKVSVEIDGVPASYDWYVDNDFIVV
jgi:hypothetical protein